VELGRLNLASRFSKQVLNFDKCDAIVLMSVDLSAVMVNIFLYIQSNLFKRDVKITAKQSRLEQNPS
jgi:hypothetical protein